MNWVDCFALLEHGRCRGGDGGGSWGGCGRGCWCSASRFFVFFRPVCLGYDGSEDGDRSCGWVVELVWWKWSVVWKWVWVLVVQVLEKRVWDVLVCLVEESDGGIVAGSLMWFSESSGKTSHIVSHSGSISTMASCRLVWKERWLRWLRHLLANV